jgi:hypothetical protein
MNAQMIEVVAKAMAQAELWDGESLETAIGFVVDEGADIVLVPAAKAAIAAVFQEIRAAAEREDVVEVGIAAFDAEWKRAASLGNHYKATFTAMLDHIETTQKP